MWCGVDCSSSQAKVLWAQRANSLFITVDVPQVDQKTMQVSFDNGVFSWSGMGGADHQQTYSTKLDLFKEVDATVRSL